VTTAISLPKLKRKTSLNKLHCPEIVIIDSFKHFTPIILSLQQVVFPKYAKDCRANQIAKETNIPVILIGHITKDGNIAGPKILEHMVDTVLQFEGDRNHVHRILRSLKIVSALLKWKGARKRSSKTPTILLVTVEHC
jgi:predicted ATP-dependent serine protease